MESKRIAIIGAGISGLIACKYVKKKGFTPVVFEMKDDVGGVWLRTLDSTLLQTPKLAFQFSDFPWPTTITNSCPTHGEVLEYIQSYARHFQLLQYIEFNSKVIGMDFVNNSENGFISFADAAWSGEAFGSGGSWHIIVHNARQGCTKVHMVDFVIVCTGRYGDIPKMPTFEAGKGPEVFKGKAMHAMELYSMDKKQVDDLISAKKVVVVGFQKSAFDIAAKCAGTNENFYGYLEEGSIVVRKSAGWGFCEKGLTLESNGDAVLEADLVILATGYESNQKIKHLFTSPVHQQLLSGSESGIVPLYRECIQPQIPEMAIIGYTEGVSNLFTSEMEIRWLVCFLSGGFRLPSAREMEDDMKKWDDYKREHSGYKYKKSSIAAVHIWFNDKLCEDMGCNPKRKKNWLSELFLPYGPADYSNL